MSKQHNALIVKSNALIESMTDMGLQEMRFLAFAASHLPHDLSPEPGRPYDMEIDVQELAEAFQIDTKNAYREVKILADKLMRKIIQFENGEREIAVGLISRRVYHRGEGRLWFRFDEELLPHLMGLTERFTSYRIRDVYQFQRQHSWRVYELLKQYKSARKRVVELEDLRRMLGLLDKYPRAIDLRKYVLDPALDEINATSDIQAQYEQKKRGRRIVGFVFHIKSNPRTRTPRETLQEAGDELLRRTPAQAPELARELREACRMNPKQARQLSDLAAMHKRVDEISAKLPALVRRFQAIKRPSTNLGGYVFKALSDELRQESLFGE